MNQRQPDQGEGHSKQIVHCAVVKRWKKMPCSQTCRQFSCLKQESPANASWSKSSQLLVFEIKVLFTDSFTYLCTNCLWLPLHYSYRVDATENICLSKPIILVMLVQRIQFRGKYWRMARNEAREVTKKQTIKGFVTMLQSSLF